MEEKDSTSPEKVVAALCRKLNQNQSNNRLQIVLKVLKEVFDAFYQTYLGYAIY